jgi:hypothetical protein
MTDRKKSALLRDLGKIQLSIFVEQQDVNTMRRSIAKKRKSAEAIGMKLSPIFEHQKNVS